MELNITQQKQTKMANEQALQDLYREFVKTGYRGSKEEFKGLMSSNDDAFQDEYKSFTSTGS